jgi:hypothetical protein
MQRFLPKELPSRAEAGVGSDDFTDCSSEIAKGLTPGTATYSMCG